MEKIRRGDIVGRKSYNKDIYFIVDKIIKSCYNTQIVILKGISIRIMADSPIDDLVKICKKELLNSIKLSEMDLNNRINDKTLENRIIKKIYTGKILHLDGDRKYSEKSARYYKKMGLNGIVKNITENRQPKVVVPLLKKYNPDILIITGHDAMLKNGSNYNNIYNYRNSRVFYKYSKRGKNMGKEFR